MQIPDNLSVQSSLIGAPEPMSIEAVLAAPNGGYLCARRGPTPITERVRIRQ
jgi:hypothetical protein